MGFPSQTADSFRYTTEEISVNLCFTPGKNLSEKYKMNRLKKKKEKLRGYSSQCSQQPEPNGEKEANTDILFPPENKV